MTRNHHLDLYILCDWFNKNFTSHAQRYHQFTITYRVHSASHEFIMTVNRINSDRLFLELSTYSNGRRLNENCPLFILVAKPLTFFYGSSSLFYRSRIKTGMGDKTWKKMGKKK
jgi:hypothetical protein